MAALANRVSPSSIGIAREGQTATLSLMPSHGRLGEAGARLLLVPGEELVQAEIVHALGDRGGDAARTRAFSRRQSSCLFTSIKSLMLVLLGIIGSHVNDTSAELVHQAIWLVFLNDEVLGVFAAGPCIDSSSAVENCFARCATSG